MCVLYQYHKDVGDFIFRITDRYHNAAHHKKSWKQLKFGLNIDIGE